MKAKKTILTLLLCFGLVSSALVGCGTDDSNSKETNENENVTTDGVLENDNADTDEVESVEDDTVIVEDDFDGIPCKDCKIMGVEFTPITTTFDEFMEAHPELICISGQTYNSADDIIRAGQGAKSIHFQLKDIKECTYIISFKNVTDSDLRLGDCIMCRDFSAMVDETKPEMATQYPLLSINGLTIGDVFASVDDLNSFVGMEYEKVFDRTYEGNYMTYRYVVNECYLRVDLNNDTGTIVGLSYYNKNNYSK